jgi:hypothetical protein
VAVSDQGRLVTARLTRAANGQINGVETVAIHRLRQDQGNPLRRPYADSEGIALGPDGSFYVSFEGPALLRHYASPDAPAETLPRAPSFADLPNNSALEALALDADGTLYTLPERPPNAGPTFPVYRFRNGVWDETLTILERNSFAAVSADFGPDGRFYLLERSFLGLPGFASRLRRFTLGPDGFIDEVTLLQSPPGLHDNLEGLSVWRDSRGQLRATMVSDDNFVPLLRTELVEYLLPD